MDVDAELYGNPAITEATTTTTTTTTTSEPAEKAEAEKKEMVSFTLNFNKQNYPLEWPLDDTILNLKNEIFNQTRVPVPLQKLMFKGVHSLFLRIPELIILQDLLRTTAKPCESWALAREQS